MGLNWAQLIEERNVWVAHNFPGDAMETRAHQSSVGVIEELGELAHSWLKEEQAIRGTPEEHQAAGKDAVGDLIVYLLGVMNAYRHTPALPDEALTRFLPAEPLNDLLKLSRDVGSLSRAILLGDLFTPHRIGEYIDKVILSTARYATHRQWNFAECVQSVWDEVKQRDWILYPDTGLPPTSLTGRHTVTVQHGRVVDEHTEWVGPKTLSNPDHLTESDRSS